MLQPLGMAMITFYTLCLLLTLIPEALVWLTLGLSVAGPVSGCWYAAQYTDYLQPEHEYALLAGVAATLLYTFFHYSQAVRTLAPCLKVGALTLLAFPSIIFLQLALLVAWGLWATQAAAAIERYSSTLLPPGGYTPLDLLQASLTSPATWLSLHLVATTGAMFSFNTLVTARLSAARFYMFEGEYPLGALSAAASVARHASGTAAWAGMTEAAVVAAARALGCSRQAAQASQEAAQAANWMGSIVAGVTALPYWGASAEALALVSPGASAGGAQQAATLLLAVTICRKFKDLVLWGVWALCLWWLLATLRAELSWQRLLGSLPFIRQCLCAALVAYLAAAQAMDGLHTATVATMVCYWEQRKADRGLGAGSAAARRVHGAIERELEMVVEGGRARKSV